MLERRASYDRLQTLSDFVLTAAASTEIRTRPKTSTGPYAAWLAVGHLGSHASWRVAREMLLILRAAYKDHEFALFREGHLVSERDGE